MLGEAARPVAEQNTSRSLRVRGHGHGASLGPSPQEKPTAVSVQLDMLWGADKQAFQGCGCFRPEHPRPLVLAGAQARMLKIIYPTRCPRLGLGCCFLLSVSVPKCKLFSAWMMGQSQAIGPEPEVTEGMWESQGCLWFWCLRV